MRNHWKTRLELVGEGGGVPSLLVCDAGGRAGGSRQSRREGLTH